MKVLLIHKLHKPYKDEKMWYGWFSFGGWIDDNVPEFSGRTKEESLENARFHAKKFHQSFTKPADWEAEILDLEPQ